MIIRKSTQDDWDTLWILLSLMGKTDCEENTRQRFFKLLDDEQHFISVAIIANQIVGYGWVQDYGFHLRAGKKTSRLNDLFVLPEYRNLGVATKLFQSIQEWANNNQTTWLQWNSSPSAVDFYKKLGLEPLVEEDDYPFFEIVFKGH